MLNLTEISILKSRSGVYQNTSENRRLHRVGMRYGVEKKQEPVKELKKRVDKEDADKVMKEEEEKEQKDKALQAAIDKYKETQDYLKKEVQAIKDMAKKLKRKVDPDELEDIMYDFEVWMDDYGSELKVDIEKDVKEDNLTLEEVEDYLDELEEYALSYYEQDVKGVKEELEELAKKLKNSKGKSPKTAEDYRKLGSRMTDEQFKKYLELPGVKERYEEAKIKFKEGREVRNKTVKIYREAEDKASHFVENKTKWDLVSHFMDSDSNGDYFHFNISGHDDEWNLEIDGKAYLNGGNVELEINDPEYLDRKELKIIQEKIDIISKNKKEFDKLILDLAHKAYDDNIAKEKYNTALREYGEMYNGYGGVREVRD